MKNLSFALRMLAVATFTLALCSVAQAITRTFVSNTGDDDNPCTVNLPCRTFVGAYNKTDARGEINALTSGDFGFTISISKSITIDGGAGHVASLTPLGQGGHAIAIAAAPGDTVIIRNLTLNGRDVVPSGLHYGLGGLVVLENVTFDRFTSTALTVKNFGVAANPLKLEINNCRFNGNLVGIQQEDNTFVAMRDSIITGTLHKGPPNSFGINMQPAAGTRASIKLDNNEISFCHNGIRATSTDLGKGDVDIHARNNWVYKNVIGLNVTNAVVLHTAGNNLLSENDFPQAGAPVTVGHFTF